VDIDDENADDSCSWQRPHRPTIDIYSFVEASDAFVTRPSAIHIYRAHSMANTFISELKPWLGGFLVNRHILMPIDAT
jgi:hypothetical protein